MIKINTLKKQNISFGHSYFSTPTTMLPEKDRNFCLFNQNKADFIASQGKNAFPYLKETLKNSKDEKEIVEALCIIDKMLDNGTKGIPSMYPTLAKFNDTKSPNIQVFLAGIYRKTQVPDAFGPLVKMLIQNSTEHNTNTTKKPTFDPNEEIGGAILAYIENYSNHPKAIDYTA